MGNVPFAPPALLLLLLSFSRSSSSPSPSYPRFGLPVLQLRAWEFRAVDSYLPRNRYEVDRRKRSMRAVSEGSNYTPKPILAKSIMAPGSAPAYARRCADPGPKGLAKIGAGA